MYECVISIRDSKAFSRMSPPSTSAHTNPKAYDAFYTKPTTATRSLTVSAHFRAYLPPETRTPRMAKDYRFLLKTCQSTHWHVFLFL